LQGKLEEELAKAELRWGSTDIPSDQFVQLRLAAQKLADQLSQVEEMEAKLERMLEGRQASNTTLRLGDMAEKTEMEDIDLQRRQPLTRSSDDHS
jgi:hypothetical protein